MGFAWVKCASVRAAKTFCQTMATKMAIGQAIDEVGWVRALSESCVAAILSLLTSLAGLPEVKQDESEQKYDTWIKSAGVRSIKTFSQTMISDLVVGQAIDEVGWVRALSESCVAAILSLLTSLAGLPEVKQDEQKKEEG